MLNRSFLPLLLVVPTLAVQGCWSYDISPTHIGAVAGYHGFSGHYAEIGVARYQEHIERFEHGSLPVSAGTALTSELKAAGPFVMGTQASAWFSFLYLTTGLNAVYYTDFTHGAFVIRPEIGVGDIPLGRINGTMIMGRMVYGYNIGGSIEGMNRSELGIRMVFPLWTPSRSE